MTTSQFNRDVCVIGGAGHVGLPLAMKLADAGLRTLIFDINPQAVTTIRQGRMPFAEEGGELLLEKVLRSGRLEIESTPEKLADCRHLILVVGTPVDEHLNPSLSTINRAIAGCRPWLRDGQILILRSTVFPGTSHHLQNRLFDEGLDVRVANCPERVTQGHALVELGKYPQIISAFDAQTLAAVRRLFFCFVSEFVEMTPIEAELSKLMTNSWRYIQFAIVNQFYMIATRHGLDFDRILHGCRHHYGRMADAPGPGFAAGPCLVKDTMQLAAFSQNQFVLGHSAMLINEGLPSHLIELCKRDMDLSQRTAGILGMAFKADSDDPRDSLSYKLRKLLTFEAREVLCCDPHVKDSSLVPIEQVLEQADVIFVGVPHSAYRDLPIPAGKKVLDVWNCVRRDADMSAVAREMTGSGEPAVAPVTR